MSDEVVIFVSPRLVTNTEWEAFVDFQAKNGGGEKGYLHGMTFIEKRDVKKRSYAAETRRR